MTHALEGAIQMTTLEPQADRLDWASLTVEIKVPAFPFDIGYYQGPAYFAAISGDLLSAVISIRYILGFRKDNPNVFKVLVQNLPHC